MSYGVERLPMVIQLGRETETGVQEVRFDVSGWLEKWPGMRLSMLARTPGGNVYPAVTAMEGTELVWRVSDADTAEPGTGGVEIVGELDGVRKVSATVATRILPRLSGVMGEVPQASRPWVDKVLAVGIAEAVAHWIDGDEPVATLEDMAGGFRRLVIGIPRRAGNGSSGGDTPDIEVNLTVDEQGAAVLVGASLTVDGSGNAVLTGVTLTVDSSGNGTLA